MVRLRFRLHHLTPWLIGGASGLHIIVRVWQLSRAPARYVPPLQFLISHTDMLIVICGSPVLVWYVAQDRDRASKPHASAFQAAVIDTLHQLRQTFTVLLIGLGLIRRRLRRGETAELDNLAQRLYHVVISGIEAIRKLDIYETPNGHEDLGIDE
jgi:hypothetical protein